MEATRGCETGAARQLANVIREEVEKANPLKDDGFFAVTLRDALQAIDYTQVARAIIGDLDSMGKSD